MASCVVGLLGFAAVALASARPGDSDFLTEQLPQAAVSGSYDRYTMTLSHPKKLFTDMWSENLRQLQYDAAKIRETTGIEMSPYSALETEEVANQITNDILRIAEADSKTWTFTSKKGVAVGVRYNGHLLPLPNIPNFDKAMEVLGQQSQFQIRGPLRMSGEGEEGADLKTLSLEVETAEHDNDHHGVTMLKDANAEPPPENVATEDRVLAAERASGVSDQFELNDMEVTAATKPGAILTGISVVAIVGILITAMVQMGNSNFGLGIVLILLAVSLAVDVWHIWQMPPSSMSLNAPPPADAQRNLNAQSKTESEKDEQTKKDMTPSASSDTASKTTSLETVKDLGSATSPSTTAIEGREAVASNLEQSLQEHSAAHERVASKTNGSDEDVDSWLKLAGLDATPAASDSPSLPMATAKAEATPHATPQQHQQAAESSPKEAQTLDKSTPSVEAHHEPAPPQAIASATSEQPIPASQLEVQNKDTDLVVMAALTAARQALSKDGPDAALAAAATAARAAGAVAGNVAKIVGQVANKLFETESPNQEALPSSTSNSPKDSSPTQAEATTQIGTTATKPKRRGGPKLHNLRNGHNSHERRNGKRHNHKHTHKQGNHDGGNLEQEWAKTLL